MSNCPREYFEHDGVCLPRDEERRNEYLSNHTVSNPLQHDAFKTTLWWSSLVALGFGLLWMTLVWCAPKMAPMIAHAGAILLLIALGVLTLVLWDQYKPYNNSAFGRTTPA